jgi:hypothetical protein
MSKNSYNSPSAPRNTLCCFEYLVFAPSARGNREASFTLWTAILARHVEAKKVKMIIGEL